MTTTTSTIDTRTISSSHAYMGHRDPSMYRQRPPPTSSQSLWNIGSGQSSSTSLQSNTANDLSVAAPNTSSSSSTTSNTTTSKTSTSATQSMSSSNHGAWARPPPPFRGPPPIPTHLSNAINPAQWQAGYWQRNPHYNPMLASQLAQGHHSRMQGSSSAAQQPHAPSIPWIPSQGWRMQGQYGAPYGHPNPQQQQQQSVNPFKRVPKPPSAEYLATKLSDNPLGLEGMDASKSLYRDIPEEDPIANAQTPWIWQSRELAPNGEGEDGEETDSEEETDEEESQDDEPQAVQREPPQRQPSVEPESFTSKLQLQPTFSTRIVLTPEHYRTNHRSRSSDRQTPQPSQYPTPQQSMSSEASSGSSSSSTSITGATLSDEPMSMLSPLILPNTPRPSSSARALAAAAAAGSKDHKDYHPHHPSSLGRHATVLAIVNGSTVLGTIPEAPNSSISRTSTYPSISPNSHSSSASASAYAASQQNQSSSNTRHQSYDSNSSPYKPPSPSYPTKSNSQQASPVSQDTRTPPNPSSNIPTSSARSPPPHPYAPQHYPTYPPPNPVSSARSPPPHGTYPYTSNSLPPPSTSASSSTPNPKSPPPQPISTSGPLPISMTMGTPSRPGQLHQQISYSGPLPYAYSSYPPSNYLQTPPNSASFQSQSGTGSSASHSATSSYFPPYQYGGPATPTPASRRNSAPHDNGNGSPGSGSGQQQQPTQKSSLPPPATTSYSFSYPTPPSVPSSSPTKEPASPPKVQHTHVMSGHPVVAPAGKRRKGWWNRRGDHLTPEGYIVYAPPALANPPDLMNYPVETEGYQDEHQNFTEWVQRPELPESLPRHGREPERPYETFIKWI